MAGVFSSMISVKSGEVGTAKGANKTAAINKIKASFSESFKTYINEAAGRGVVAAFGRMQPPTIGHGLLVKKVVETAKKNRCDHVIYLSKTNDAKKNPLPVDVKVAWAKKLFPGANIVGSGGPVATIIDMVKQLNAKYKILYIVAGSDRVDEYQQLLNKYNGKEYNYDKIEVVSAGERDPDADGAAGMSATKMREAAAANNVEQFKQGLPEHVHKEAAKMMAAVRAGMKL